MKHHAIGPEALPFGMGIGAFGIGLASKFATEPAADTQASPPGIAPCCPRAASGHAATVPPSSVMNSRRLIFGLIRSPRRRGREAWLGLRGRAPWRFLG